jgi:hypothetical protein
VIRIVATAVSVKQPSGGNAASAADIPLGLIWEMRPELEEDKRG